MEKQRTPPPPSTSASTPNPATADRQAKIEAPTQNFVLELATRLRWPLVIVFFLILFRYQIGYDVGQLVSFHGLGLDASFSPGKVTVASLPKTVNAVGTPMPVISIVAFVPDSVKAGAIARGVAVYDNTGEVEVLGALFHYVRIVDTPWPDQQSQREDTYYNLFVGQIPRAKFTIPIPPKSLDFSYNEGPIISGQMVDGFLKGRKTVYFMGLLRYRTGQQTVQAEYCRFVTMKGTFACVHHNEIVSIP